MNNWDKPITRVNNVNVSEDGTLLSIDVEKTPELMDLLKTFGDRLSGEMGRSMDASLFFPVFDYEKRKLSLIQKAKAKWREYRERIDTAIEVLRGHHYCGDDF